MSKINDKIFSAGVAILLNALLVYALIKLIADDPVSALPERRVQLVWVMPPGIAPMPAPPTQPRRESAVTKPQSSKTAAPVPTSIETPPQAAEPYLQQADDRWLSTHLPATASDELTFRKDPMKRPAQDVTAAPVRLQVRFTDSSFGGLMQRMTKRNICAELKNQLRSGSGSADTILTTMKHYGCAS